MPRRDTCHSAVVQALKKEGWSVRSDVFIGTEQRSAFVDIEASRGMNGQQQRMLMAEVKCFVQDTSEELYTAIGQYIIYSLLLAKQPSPPPLYLAVPHTIYETTFDEIAREAIIKYQIKMIIVDIESEVILQWILPSKL